jgi:predicted DsbA family dithiol-disulfide isomerase
MSAERLRVTVVSDYICPWCYVGLARADRLAREFEIDITWHPYELHPEIPPGGVDRPERARRPQGAASPLRTLAEEAGLSFQPSRHVPNSHRALEAAEFARAHGAFDAYHRALFEAHFGRGLDIGEVSVLTELGAANGLDAAELKRALTSGTYRALIDRRTEEARLRGVSGTPTFIFEKDGIEFPLVGAQDYVLFENVARRMGAERRLRGAAARSAHGG